ncbi:hypothetical protein [Sphingopyxis fribergensis]
MRWLVLALAGTAGGMMLGDLVVGKRTNDLSDEVPSFSRLSANPDAAMPQGEGASACADCADSYGVAARLRVPRDERMDDAFRELGAVDVDPPGPDTPVDDYRYGGRFPDTEPRPPDPVTEADEEEIAPLVPAGGIPPAGEPPPLTAAEG